MARRPLGPVRLTQPAWSVKTSALSGGVHAITAQATDFAGNIGAPSGALSVTIDTTAPLVPSVPDLTVASDSGASDTDNTTNISAPTFTGTADAGATVTLFDGATDIGSSQADAAGLWSVATNALAAGSMRSPPRRPISQATSARRLGCSTVTIDTAAPVAPSVPDLAVASDSGASVRTIRPT